MPNTLKPSSRFDSFQNMCFPLFKKLYGATLSAFSSRERLRCMVDFHSLRTLFNTYIYSIEYNFMIDIMITTTSYIYLYIYVPVFYEQIVDRKRGRVVKTFNTYSSSLTHFGHFAKSSTVTDRISKVKKFSAVTGRKVNIFRII